MSDQRFDRIDSNIDLLKWLLAVQLVITLATLIRTFLK